jgi:hypothetical protein
MFRLKAVLVVVWGIVTFVSITAPPGATGQPLRSMGETHQSTIGVPDRPNALDQAIVIRRGEQRDGFGTSVTNNVTNNTPVHVDKMKMQVRQNTAISAGIINNGEISGGLLKTERSNLDASTSQSGSGPINHNSGVNNTETKTVLNPTAPALPTPSPKPGKKNGSHHSGKP